MSDEYISRADAVDTIKKNFKYLPGYMNATINYIKALPPADVAPVVRCRDCKHWQRGMVGMGCYWDADYPHEENDFCSHGEKKEE